VDRPERRAASFHQRLPVSGNPKGRWEDHDGENSFSRIRFYPDDIVRLLLPAGERRVEGSGRSDSPSTLIKIFSIIVVVTIGD
jgi:hypothetical protein